ncbi:tripartite tricarboxylate transporter TctB family protein [Xanthobacter sp. KR7-225]|uniref:tripartite tricarboxylate transporter TctB family protein n=1 Tax=Xanthobacter sp. KR7-225 TaxID=3156613 RepID=UPI0032B54A41
MEQSRRITRGQVRIASAILTLFGALYTWQATRLPIGDPVGSEAGGTPMVIGVLWVLFGLYVTLRAPAPAVQDDEVGTWPSRAMAGRLVAVAALCGAYIVLLPWLGTIATSFLFMTAMARMCGAPWLRAMAASIVLAVAFWTLFVNVLDLSLPTGAFFNALRWG